MFPAKEGNQVLHCSEGRLGKGRRVQFTGQTRGGPRPQPDRLSIPRLVAQQQAKAAELLQAFLKQREAPDVEVGGGDVQ